MRSTHPGRPERLASTRLPGEIRSALEARHFCVEQLRAWGCSRDAQGLVQLVVSELVTNAVCHTEGPATVTLRLTGDELRVEVEDESIGAVDEERTRGDELGGWGIPIVAAIARHWGVHRHEDHHGKTIWADLTLG